MKRDEETRTNKTRHKESGKERERSEHQIIYFFLNGLEKGANFNLCQSFALVMRN